MGIVSQTVAPWDQPLIVHSGAKKPEESHEASGGGQEYDSGMSAEHESVGSKEDFPYGDIQGYGEVNEENGEASGDEVHDLHDEHDITASGDEEKPQSKNGTHSRGRSKGFTKYNNRGQLVWRMEKVDKWGTSLPSLKQAITDYQ